MLRHKIIKINNLDWILIPDKEYILAGYKIKKVINERKSKYQEYIILDIYSFGRMLIIDGRIQSSEYNEYIYHEILVHPILCTIEMLQKI